MSAFRLFIELNADTSQSCRAFRPVAVHYLAAVATIGAERGRNQMSEASEAGETTIITAFEHHRGGHADVDVAILGARKWCFLTVEEARDLAQQLWDAADLAEERSRDLEVPLRER